MSKSRTYSSQDVQSVRVDGLNKGHEAEAATVGVDVSKADLKLVIRWASGAKERPLAASNPGQVPQVVELLRELSRGRKLVVAMESTGTYGDVFRQAVTQAGLELQRVGGKAVHDYAETFDGVPSQHDGKDAGVIAELAAMGKGKAWPWRRGSETQQQIQACVDLLGCYSRHYAMWLNQIEAWLARHWPELGELLEIGSPTVLQMLAHYGSPAALAADAEAESRLRAWGGPMLTQAKIAAVRASAAATLGIACSGVDRQRAGRYAQETLAAQEQMQAQRRALRELGASQPNIERVGRAVGQGTACVVYASVGDPASYSSPGAFVKALGLNLTERSSGRHHGTRHISKRGPAGARRWLYFAALRCVQHEQVKPWYQRKLARDNGRGTPALVAVMRKLAMAIYRMCKDQVPFDPGKLFPGRPSRAKEVTMR